MPAIHLIQNTVSNHPRSIKGDDNAWTTGNWHVSLATAELLLDGDLYLHTAQDAPSHFGGKIYHYEQVNEPDSQQRIVFYFRFSPAYRDVISRGGWSQEKKIVLP